MAEHPKEIQYTFNGKWQFARIPSDAETAINILLTDRERKLLYCLAGCKAGFRPSAKYIEMRTGLDVSHMYKARHSLEDNGFITMSSDTVKIEWENIINKSRMLMAGGEISASLGQPRYPRNKRKAPETGRGMLDATSARKATITDIYYNKDLYDNSCGKESIKEPTIRQMIRSDRLHELQLNGEISPACDDYTRSRIAGMTYRELDDYIHSDFFKKDDMNAGVIADISTRTSANGKAV